MLIVTSNIVYFSPPLVFLKHFIIYFLLTGYLSLFKTDQKDSKFKMEKLGIHCYIKQ